MHKVTFTFRARATQGRKFQASVLHKRSNSLTLTLGGCKGLEFIATHGTHILANCNAVSTSKSLFDDFGGQTVGNLEDFATLFCDGGGCRSRSSGLVGWQRVGVTVRTRHVFEGRGRNVSCMTLRAVQRLRGVSRRGRCFVLIDPKSSIYLRRSTGVRVIAIG